MIIPARRALSHSRHTDRAHARRWIEAEDVADLGAKLPSNGRDAVQAAVANDLRLISDPQVHSVELDGQPGADAGAMSKLPESIRHDLTSKPGDLATFNGLNALGTLMSKGDTTIQGSDINRAMVKQGSELVAFTDGHAALKDGPLPKVADSFLNDAAGDHAAVHDAILANPNSSDPDARAAADRMNVTCGGGGKYYGSQHVIDVLQHHWSPDQHGAENMFKWIGQDASLPKGSFANNEAGQTAFGLASILGDSNNQSVLNSPDNPLGAKNPALTQTLANTMAPYLGNFVDVHDYPGMSLLNSAPVDSTGQLLKSPFRDSADLSKMFAVLDSDPQAARTINSAGMQWHDALEYASGVNTDHAPSLQANAGNLQQAMNAGLTTDINAHAAERSYQAAQQYADRGVFADGVTSVVQTAASIGGGPVAGPVVGGIAASVDSYIKADVIPNPADPAHPLADDKVSTELGSIRDSINSDPIRDEYLQTQGYVQQHPEAARYFDQPDGGNLVADWHNVTTDNGLNEWRDDYSRFEHDTNRQLPNDAFPAPPEDRNGPITESDVAPRGKQKPPGAK
ncbi:TPR repeat region-containing protein [Nocardia nova]|uniref:TPR repeat region-containing protein n=1 Tax=Nocardia nova TaxID=37330 RepID=UPI003F762BF9